MPTVLKDKLREWREFRVQRLGQRIAVLNQCIDGTDESMYPDIVADYYRERQDAALKRSAILVKLGQEANH